MSGGPARPRRPGFGSGFGRCYFVNANHFRVTVPDRDFRQYDVSISPEVGSKKVRRDIMKQLVATYKDSHLGQRMLAYDGRRTCYTAGPLPFKSQLFHVFHVKLLDANCSSKEREFKVSIKFALKLDLKKLGQFINSREADVPHQTLRSLNVVLAHNHSNSYTVVGRSFFSPNPRHSYMEDLGNGVDYWKGFYQSVRPTQMGLSLIIDTTAKAFFQPLWVTQYVEKHINRDVQTHPLYDKDYDSLNKALKGVTVEVLLGVSRYCRRHKVLAISNKSCQELQFALEGTGTEISLTQYFLDKYKECLRHPHLPALEVDNKYDDTKPYYLPMEVCRIVEGERYSPKLNETQATALLKATCKNPEKRERSIKKIVAKNKSQDFLLNKEFGIHVVAEPTLIRAKCLFAPSVIYRGNGEENVVYPLEGKWNMMDNKMIDGGNVEFWTCINFSKLSIEKVEKFCKDVIEMCIIKGMVCSRQPLVPVRNAQPCAARKALFDVEAEAHSHLQKLNTTPGKKRLHLLIVVLHERSNIYGKIKRVCETELGIMSQCFHPKNIEKTGKQYRQCMGNVALKINAKVGGRNCVLQVAWKGEGNVAYCPTIIFGADVSHPQPGEDSHLTPSIASVVASMDWPQATKYRGLASTQPHRKEIIQDLYSVDKGGMIREHLLAFYEANGKRKPERIIFYRDGVSEGQFNQVLLHEVDAIKKACRSIEENYVPRVTFIVVQKRHRTRLFVDDHHGGGSDADNSGNVLAGTVVDSEICHPVEFDFYMCSHAGVQGTSRPTHYHVLYDENRFTADGVQVLTNHLCYTYVKCNRSVSVVPPVYYADLLARRARHYIEGDDAARNTRVAPESGLACGSSSTNTTSIITRKIEAKKEISSLCRIKNLIFSNASTITKKKIDIPSQSRIRDCNSTMRDNNNEIIPTLPRIKDSIKDLMFFI